jgi:hypothetical protein
MEGLMLSINRTKRATAATMALVFTVFQVALFWPVGVAAAGADDDLKNIQYKYYFRGDYGRAITELRSYLERPDLTSAQEVGAREYLAASLIMSGNSAAGKSEYIKILKLDSTYTGPDPGVFKAVVVSTYQEAHAEYASNVIRNVPDDVVTSEGTPVEAGTPEQPGKPIYKKWWFYAAAGAVLLIVAGAASGSKTGDDEPASTGTVTVDVGVQ